MPTQYETDRARFIGRGRALDRPVAMASKAAAVEHHRPRSRSDRQPPAVGAASTGGTARLTFTTGFADTEAAARALIEKYHDRRAVARALALASTHSQIELRHLGLTDEDTMQFQRLAGRLLYGDPRLRIRRP